MSLFENCRELISKLEESAKESKTFKEFAEKNGFNRENLNELLIQTNEVKERIFSKFRDSANVEIDLPEGKQLIFLDASVIRAKNLIQAMDKAIKAGFVFVMSSIVIENLDVARMLINSEEELGKIASNNAEKLLEKAVKEEKNIKVVGISNTFYDDFELLIDIDKKYDITLWSADELRILKARRNKIKYLYVEEEIKLPKEEQKCLITLGFGKTNMCTKFGEDGNLYLAGKLNPLTTRIEVYTASGIRKPMAEPLQLGDGIISVQMGEELEKVSVNEKQLVKYSGIYDFKTVYAQELYRLDEWSIGKAFPAKYTKIVQKFLCV